MKKLLLLFLLSSAVQGFAQTPVFKSISPPIQTNGGFIIIQKGVVVSNGDYYIIGTFSGPVDFDPGPNVVNAPNPFHTEGYFDAFIAKYSSTDALLWMKPMWTRGPFINQGSAKDPHLRFNDITIGADGNVYIVGDILGTADGIGDQVTGFVVINGEFPRAFAKGLTPAGDVIFNARNEHGIIISASTGEGIAADGSGNVFITGFQSGEVNGISSGSQQHAYYAKFNSSGVRINQGWMIQTSTTPSDFNSNRHSRGNAIAVDGSGNIYITGFFGQSADFDPGAGTNIINSVNLKDAFIAKWTSSNAFSWVRTYSTASEGTEIELDANGNVYAAIGNNFIKLTNAGADSWNRNLGYAHSFTINASNELLVARTNTELRFLKLSAANEILYEIAPTYVSGSSTNVNRSFVGEYGNGDVRWINKSVSNYNYGNGPSGDLADGAFIRYGRANTAPTNIILSAASINENNAVNAVIGSLTSTDANPGDSHTYSLVAGTGSTDNASFNISGNQLRAGITFNFEAKSSYSVRVRAFDGTESYEKPFSINISDANDVPYNLLLSANTVNENNALGTTIGTFTVSDTDVGDTHTYGLVAGEGGTDNASFTIFQGQLKANTVFDYESKATYYIRVRASDGQASIDSQFTITVNDLVDTDIDAPVVESLSPTDGTSNVPLDGTLVVTFDENIDLQASGGYVRVRKLSNNAVVLEGRPLFDTDIFTKEGNTLSFSLADFTGTAPAYGTNYYVTIDEHTIEDEAGNYYDGFADNSTWDFTTSTELESDVTAPVIVGFDPISGSSDYPYNRGTLSMTFSEPVVERPDGQKVFYLRNIVGNTTIAQFAIGTSDVTISGNKVTLNNVPDLNPDITYWVQCPLLDPFTDLAGNHFVGWSGNTSTWQFTARSGAAVISRSPTHTSTNIPTYANVEIVFDQEVFLAPWVNQFAFISLNGSNAYNFTASGEGTTWTKNGNALVLNPWFDFGTNATYKVRVYGLVNSAGEPVKASEYVEWEFTTGTQVNNAPIGITLSKDRITEGNAIGAVVASLSTADANSSDVHSYSLVSGQGDSGNSSFTVLGNLLVAAESFDYSAQDSYSVRIRTQDDKGGYFESYYGISINTAPSDITITNSSINENNSVGAIIGYLGTTDQNIGDTFSYSLVEGDGSHDNGSFTLVGTTLKANAVFDYETKSSYSIRARTFDGIAYFEKIITISINYVDTHAPTITDRWPVDDATGVPIDADLVMIFNEPVKAGNSFIYLKEVGQSLSTLYGLVEEGSSLFTVDGNTLTIHLSQYNGVAPAYSTSYYVEFYSGAIKDLADNSAQGFSDPTVWNFTTMPEPDNEAPTKTSLSPTNGAVDVAKNTNLVITFNEAIALGSGEIKLLDKWDNTIETYSASANSSRLNFSGNQLTIDPTNELLANQEFYVLIGSSAIVDLSQNPYAGISSQATWHFTTLQVGLAPTDISLSADHFDESIGSGQVIATLSAVDPDANTNTFEMIYVEESGTAYDDFYIGGNLLYSGFNGFEFTEKSEYALKIKAVDDDNNEFIKDLVIYVNDNEPPVELSKAPMDDATEVVGDVVFVITFDEAITIPENDQAVVVYRNGSPDFIMASDDSRLTIDDNELTIDLGIDLDSETDYYVWLKGVSDLNDNYFTQSSPETDWNFTTGDFQAPQITTLFPANNATAVAIQPNLLITFDEDVELNISAASAYFQIRTISGNSLVQQINWNSSHVAVVNGNQISITGIEPLPANTEFWIKAYSLDNVFVTDAVDNELSPWNNDNEVWRFTTDKLEQSITFPDIEDKPFGVAPFSLGAEASSGLEITYNVPTSNATVLNGVLTVVSAGDVTVQAMQAGNDEFKAAVTVERTFTVNKAAQTISVDQIDDKSISDDPFAVSATVGSGLPLAYSVSGPATNVGNQITLSGVTGEVTVTISQAGNANYLAAESVVLTFLVTDPNKQNQTITFAAISDKAYGDIFTLGASSSSGLSVAYEVVDGPATLNGSALTLNGLGIVTVKATQAGDDDYNPAAQVSRSFEVGKAMLTVTADSKQMTYGGTLPDFTYTVTGFVNNETADVIAGSIEATTEASASSDAGEYTITVSGGTADNYVLSYVDGTLTIGKADQLITFETLETKTFGDASFDLAASVDSGLGLTYSTSDEAVATIEGSTVTIVRAGTATITATQAGSDNYHTAETSQELTISKASQTITFEAIDNHVLSTGSLTLSATASSGLAVNYEVSGPATLAGTILTFTGAGDITVTASQAGNVNYMAAIALPRTFTVTDDSPVDPVKLDQTIAFEALSDKTFGDAAFDLTAAASSGLPVSYTVTGSATISGSTVTITGAGSVTVTAGQAGDDSFNAAADVAQSFTVNKATAAITLSDLEQQADGTPKTPTVVTDPAGLEVVFTFDGETIIPVSVGNYTVVAIINDANYQGSAEAVFELTEVVETGIGDELSQILVYPNPFVETIKIEGKNLRVIRLHNLNGQVMFERAVTEKTELTTPDLMPGVYLLYLIDGEGRSNVRRMVKK